MITPERIESLIVSKLPDARVRLNDLTGGGDHWEAVVVSAAFQGKSLVEQHQLVYSALGAEMKQEIHALQLRTLTPEKAAAGG